MEENAFFGIFGSLFGFYWGLFKLIIAWAAFQTEPYMHFYLYIFMVVYLYTYKVYSVYPYITLPIPVPLCCEPPFPITTMNIFLTL